MKNETMELNEIPNELINTQLLRPIESMERELLKCEQVDCPVTHRFAPGVYYREIFMPAGSFIIGHQHKTEHLNVITEGRARVLMDGVIHEIVAPCVIKSNVDVRKVLYIIEDMRWATIHVTDETDLDKLEEQIITKSDAFIEHHHLLQLMPEHYEFAS